MMKRTIVFLLALLTLTTACIGDNLTLLPPTESFSNATSLVVVTTPSPAPLNPDEMPLTPVPVSSTATPSTAPSNTVTPTVELTPTPAPQNVPSKHPGAIFVWIGMQYGYLAPWEYQEDYGFVFAETPDRDPSFQAKTLAFSQNSQQVAYVFYEDHAMLWIANIDLQNAVLLWVDENDWLTYFAEGSSGYITWGPNDHFVILFRKAIGMVYQLQNGIATQLSGACDRIAASPATNLLAIWCPISDEQGNAFLVLEQDGSALREVELPVENVLARDWVFAPNSNRVLYASDNGELFVWNGDLNSQLDLNMLYGYRAVSETKLLKWSYDGTRLIVFGYLNGDYCPESLSGEKLACWSIRDANTGEILWWPNEGNLSSEAVGALTDGLDAALSPDNKWIVMSYRADLIRHTIIVSIETGEVREVSSRSFEAIYWSR